MYGKNRGPDARRKKLIPGKSWHSRPAIGTPCDKWKAARTLVCVVMLTAVNSPALQFATMDSPLPTSSCGMNRVLIVYYSRSGATRALAAELAAKLGADMAAIKEPRSRIGVSGFLRSMLETVRGTLPPIEPLHVDLPAYALVLLGTPVWAGRAASPIRSFLRMTARSLPPTAYFCTYGGSGHDTAFQDMARRQGQRPLATLAVRRRELPPERHADALEAFLTRMAPARQRGAPVEAARHHRAHQE